MPWAIPKYSNAEVNRAGRILVSDPADLADLDERESALQVINNWRSSHSFPLNTMQMTLRRVARLKDPGALVAQRIKRLSSIRLKLVRFSTMNLSQMQDIGGCRAVVSSAARAQAVRDAYLDGTLRHRHQLAREDDYIANPKKSGYRSIHLIFRYQSDRKRTYNGHQIEIQLRSKLQHAWATAVETVGTFLEQSLKSSQGSERWLRFFSLMGSELALRERRPPVPDTPTDETALKNELRATTAELNVEERLTWYSRTVTIREQPSVRDAFYYLIELRPSAGTVSVKEYPKGELEKASADYLQVERTLVGPGSEAVLVSVESLDALRRAYPNYYLDTGLFLEALKKAIA